MGCAAELMDLPRWSSVTRPSIASTSTRAPIRLGQQLAAITEERPRETGADQLADLTRRYARGLVVVQGDLAKSDKADQ